MHYFKTPLPVEQINKVLQHHSVHAETDYCIVEIQHKKSLVISGDEEAASMLMKDDNFKHINLTELDLITIPVMYRVVSITGNKDLFLAHA